MRLPKTAIPGIDRVFKDVERGLNDERARQVCFTMHVGTVSANLDVRIITPKEPMTLVSLSFDVDTAITTHGSNYWQFQLFLYRPGVTEKFILPPAVPFWDGTELVDTIKYPIPAHTSPLVIPYNATLKPNDTVVLALTKVASASNLDSFSIQTELTRAA